MKKEKKEIRDLLLGKTVMDEDGKLVTPEAGFFRVPQGVAPGAGAVRFLGIGRKERFFRSALDGDEILAEAEACMSNMGRAVRLREQPDAAACLIRYVLSVPAVLVFRIEEGVCVLTAWAGRSPSAWLSRRRALHTFEKALSGVLSPAAEAPKREKRRKTQERADAESGEEPYDGQYDGRYDEQYDGQYDGQYDEQYDGQYDGQYDEQYDGQYDGQYDEQYDGRYAEEYDGPYDGPYDARYDGPYEAPAEVPAEGPETRQEEGSAYPNRAAASGSSEEEDGE